MGSGYIFLKTLPTWYRLVQPKKKMRFDIDDSENPWENLRWQRKWFMWDANGSCGMRKLKEGTELRSFPFDPRGKDVKIIDSTVDPSISAKMIAHNDKCQSPGADSVLVKDTVVNVLRIHYNIIYNGRIRCDMCSEEKTLLGKVTVWHCKQCNEVDVCESCYVENEGRPALAVGSDHKLIPESKDSKDLEEWKNIIEYYLA